MGECLRGTSERKQDLFVLSLSPAEWAPSLAAQRVPCVWIHSMLGVWSCVDEPPQRKRGGERVLLLLLRV